MNTILGSMLNSRVWLPLVLVVAVGLVFLGIGLSPLSVAAFFVASVAQIINYAIGPSRERWIGMWVAIAGVALAFAAGAINNAKLWNYAHFLNARSSEGGL